MTDEVLADCLPRSLVRGCPGSCHFTLMRCHCGAVCDSCFPVNGLTPVVGTSDHVLYPDFDRMAAVVFPDHVGPYLLRDCGHFVPWEASHALVSGIRTFCRDLR